SMAEVAQRYGAILAFVERQRTTDLSRDLTELRQVFHSPNAPANVAPSDYSELELLPDRPAQGELQKFRKEIEQWRASGPGAPPRAMVLNDLPKQPRQRVFIRGSSTNLGEPVERQFLGVLVGKDRKPFTHGSGRLEMAKAIIDPK